MLNVPLNGRDFTQLLKLVPGVTGGGFGTSMNGTRTNSIDWQIDGVDNNDLWFNEFSVNQGGAAGIAATLLPIDAIDQLSVQSSGGAEQGRTSGGTVNLAIKSGTNQMHGSLYEYNRNDALAATNWFQSLNAVPKLKDNEFGGVLGGPIRKDRTFFFMAYEQQNFVVGHSVTQTVPSPMWVTETEKVLQANGVPANPVSLNLLSLYAGVSSAQGFGTNNYYTSHSDYDTSYNALIKLDHIFDDKNRLSLRYFGGTGQQNAFNGSVLYAYYQRVPSRMNNTSAVYNHIFSPNLTSQTLLGLNVYDQAYYDIDNGFSPVALGLNTGVTNPALAGSPDISVNGFTEVGLTAPQRRVQWTGHLDETLNYIKGSHQLRFGGEYRQALVNVAYHRNQRGSFSFDGSQGPNQANPNDTWNAAKYLPAADLAVLGNDVGDVNSLADFLSGRVAAGNASIVYGDTARRYKVDAFSLFAGDNWKVNAKLTLNYGLNWEYMSPLKDSSNRISTFIPSEGGFVYTGHGLDTIYPRDFHDVGPRFGFAYLPKVLGKLVLRGGFGIYYQTPNLNYFSDNRPGNGGATGILSNPGAYSPVYSVSNPSAFTIQSGVPIFTSGGIASPPYGGFSIDQKFTTGYTENYNANVQYQLTSSTVVEAAYNGNQSRHLPVTLDINQIPLGGNNQQSARPYNAEFPTLRAINQVESVGDGHYNGGFVSLRSSAWKNVSTQLSYTFGHARDDLSGARGNIPENSYNLRGDWGNSDFDIRNSFTGYLSYKIPSPHAYKLALGGWQLNSLLTFHSGNPFTVGAGQNISGTGEGRDRVNVVGDPFAVVPAGTPHQTVYWFNPTQCGSKDSTGSIVTNNCFALPAAGTYGNEQRNQFYGPGLSEVDFSVFKNTPITERINTQFRVEMFNLFNTRALGGPGSSLGGDLGKITSTPNNGGAPGIGAGEPFNVQIALKVTF
jgi:hypothetical protein